MEQLAPAARVDPLPGWVYCSRKLADKARLWLICNVEGNVPSPQRSSIVAVPGDKARSVQPCGWQLMQLPLCSIAASCTTVFCLKLDWALHVLPSQSVTYKASLPTRGGCRTVSKMDWWSGAEALHLTSLCKLISKALQFADQKALRLAKTLDRPTA